MNEMILLVNQFLLKIDYIAIEKQVIIIECGNIVFMLKVYNNSKIIVNTNNIMENIRYKLIENVEVVNILRAQKTIIISLVNKTEITFLLKDLCYDIISYNITLTMDDLNDIFLQFICNKRVTNIIFDEILQIITIQFYSYNEVKLIVNSDYGSVSFFELPNNYKCFCDKNIKDIELISHIQSETQFFNFITEIQYKVNYMDNTNFLFNLINVANYEGDNCWLETSIIENGQTERFELMFHKLYILSEYLLIDIMNLIFLILYVLS